MTGSMRDRIAQVIDKSLDGDCGYGVGEHLADVLLAAFPVLAGPTDEMVEAGARADFEESENGADWNTAHPAYREAYLRHARTVLVAAREARTT